MGRTVLLGPIAAPVVLLIAFKVSGVSSPLAINSAFSVTVVPLTLMASGAKSKSISLLGVPLKGVVETTTPGQTHLSFVKLY